MVVSRSWRGMICRTGMDGVATYSALAGLSRRVGLIGGRRGPRQGWRCSSARLGLPKVEAFMDKPTITLARNKCYVDGQWVGEPKLPVTNKATGEIMARVPDFGEAETRQAVEAANRALPAWSKMLARSDPSASAPGST